MGKRVRISNNSVNSYGFRVLTEGMDITQFQRNPVLLYMHMRGEVIGCVKDLKVENDELTGELVFDEVSELSKRCKRQWEFGSLKMVSVGIDVIEESSDPSLLEAGQTHPTVTKSKLYEVSLVDIGSNDDAIALRRNGKMVTLYGGVCYEDAESNNYITLDQNTTDVEPNNTDKQMEELLIEIAQALGLPEDADKEAVLAKIAELQEKAQESEDLEEENEELRLSQLTTLVSGAVADHRLSAAERDNFIELGKKIGADELKKVLGAMNPQQKLSNLVGGNSASATEYKKLSDVPATELMKIREDNVTLYKKLYKAEYGIDCTIEK